MPKTSRTVERRMTPGEVEVRQQPNGKFKIEGHAAVFESRSQNLGGFVEVVQRGAFSKTLQEADVRALYNHDENLVLGRNKSGTLRMAQDESGLYYEIDPPDTTYARDLMAVMERGDVSQSSFAFYSIRDDWGFTDEDFPLRSLSEVALVDVSVVTYPAYLGADSSVGRSAALEGLARRSHVAITDLSDPEAIKRAIRGEETPEVEEPAAATPDPIWARRAEHVRNLERIYRDSDI